MGTHKKGSIKATKDKFNSGGVMMTVNPCDFSDFAVYGNEEGDCHGSYIGRFREVESQLQRHTKEELIERIEKALNDIKKGAKYSNNLYDVGDIFESLIYLGDLIDAPIEDGVQTVWNRTKFWNVV